MGSVVILAKVAQEWYTRASGCLCLYFPLSHGFILKDFLGFRVLTHLYTYPQQEVFKHYLQLYIVVSISTQERVIYNMEQSSVST